MFLHRLFSRWFILKKNISKELFLAREDERKRVEDLSIRREKIKEAQIRENYNVKLAHKDAEIESLKMEIARFIRRENDVTRIYWKSIRQTKQALQTSIDLSHQFKTFTDSTTNMFQILESIQHKTKKIDASYEKESHEIKKFLENKIEDKKLKGNDMVIYWKCVGDNCDKIIDEFDEKDFNIEKQHNDKLCIECRNKKNQINKNNGHNFFGQNVQVMDRR